jgi:hypothetical protein
MNFFSIFFLLISYIKIDESQALAALEASGIATTQRKVLSMIDCY